MILDKINYARNNDFMPSSQQKSVPLQGKIRINIQQAKYSTDIHAGRVHPRGPVEEITVRRVAVKQVV